MKILRISEVARVTGLSTSSIYKLIRNGKFPRGVKITERATGWSSEAVENWVKSRFENLEKDQKQENL